MKQQIISEVMQQMLPHLDNAQMQQLQKTLENALFDCKITAQTEKKDPVMEFVEYILLLI